MMLLILLLFSSVDAELPSKIFDLPSLTINVEQPYLVRKQPVNLTCHLSAGWSGASLQNVIWLRDGAVIDALKHPEDYGNHSEILSVTGGKPHIEGDYQCLADVINISLSNRQVVSTKLVSSPVKLRRARITKFDKISEHMVSVQQGEVARLPCVGMPDVIPGPAEICFEREGADGCFGDRENADSNYLSTNTGMQIAFAQPTDSGNYFCVVRNEYTKQTRTSPKPVILLVHKNEETIINASPPDPALVYPAKSTSLEKPINIDVVYGSDILLECVFTGAKVVWMKHNDDTPRISLTDEEARVRQLWGNLRIRQIAVSDGGIYSCHGLSPLEEDPNLETGEHPKVYYNLVVRGPTNVNLSLSENPTDKSWDLSCLATNLRYEIPMAFVNGTALVDAIGQMGITSSTNFFTNPINATIKVKHSFSGSVQCISRPAMDEAEIYGPGLDRGVSQNVFVLNTAQATAELITKGPENVTVTVGENVQLPCLVQRVKSKYWMKNEEYVKIFGHERTKIIGSNTLLISNVTLEDEGWYKCVVKGDETISAANAYVKVLIPTTLSPETTTEPFTIIKKNDHLSLEDIRGFVTGSAVRIQWSVIGNTEALTRIAHFKIELQRLGSANDSWLEADEVDSHVRATTIKDLIPNHTYRLRVILHRDDKSTVVSNTTDWMYVAAHMGDILPESPKIEDIRMTSATSLRVSWSHNRSTNNTLAREFILFYKIEESDNLVTQNIRGNETSAEIKELIPNAVYTVQLSAENFAGKSPLSPPANINTTYIEMATIHLFGTELPLRQSIILGVTGLLIVLIMLLICCIVFCNIRRRKQNPNGKFLDTSYRIFNEQKVHKARIFEDEGNLFIEDDGADCEQLKMVNDGRSSADSSKFLYTRDGGSQLPNLYGNIDEILEIEDAVPPMDPTYVSHTRIIGSGMGNGIYGTTTTARCYSPDSGLSHEMIVPYSGSNGYNTSPQIISSPSRILAFKGGDSLLYSPAGTGSSLADTSSGVHNPRLNCDSPTNAPTENSDPSYRCESSRNSQVSSTDGFRPIPMTHMHTFKSTSPNTSSFISNTFDRRHKSEQLVD